MNFIEALKKCNYSEDRVRAHTVDAKKDVSEQGTRIYRQVWSEIEYPIKYVWVTKQNIPMASIGDNQSMPLMMEVPDFIADDWEVYE